MWVNYCNSNVSQTGVLGRRPQKLNAFLQKLAILNAFGSHSGRVQGHLKELDFYHLKANWKN